jgi:hypothetical protein
MLYIRAPCRARQLRKGKGFKLFALSSPVINSPLVAKASAYFCCCCSSFLVELLFPLMVETPAVFCLPLSFLTTPLG